MKKISIFGVTGSIGSSTVKIILLDKAKYNVQVLTANKNYKKLAKLSKLLRSKYAIIGDEKYFLLLKKELKNTNIICLTGKSNLEKFAKIKTDILISAIVGMAGLRPTYNAIGNTKLLAIANKESIVVAGNILLNKAKKLKTIVLPLDSEHHAIFQVYKKENKNNIKEIILTASGGPFWNKEKINFDKVTVKNALKHPTWRMGKKITIDSATMMNKLLEIIEASILFNLDLGKIKILIHPSSLIHGIVNFIDGTSHLIASEPDMKIPISHALHWPERLNSKVKNLDFKNIKNFKFYCPNKKIFPSLSLINILKKNDYNKSKIITINAANEVAVDYFLRKKISFNDIIKIIKKTIFLTKHININSINDVMNIDNKARNISDMIINRKI